MTRGIVVLLTLGLATLVVIGAQHETEGTRLSNDSADSKLTFNFARAIATGDAGEVHVVWFDGRVHYRRSLDDGRTWLEQVTLSAETRRAEGPAIATAGANVYAAWHELHGQTPQIIVRRSRDRGTTWDPPHALTDPAIHSAHPSIAASGTRVHLTWFDGRHGLSEIYTRHSIDFGSIWQPEQRISETNAYSWVSTIETRESEVLIAWVDYIDGNEEEYLRRSTDGGESWQPAIRFTHDDADSWAPSVALSGQIALVSWFDRRDAGVSDAEVEAKLNEALTLVGIPASPPPPRNPQIYYLPPFTARLEEKQKRLAEAIPAWVGRGGDPKQLDAILQDFERLVRQWMFGWEIYYRRSTDSGHTFGPLIRLTDADGASQRPSVVMRGQEVSIVWFDDRELDERFDVYMNSSSDGGLTWSGEKRLTHGSAVMPAAARSAGALHIVWIDTRHGAGEIYYQRIPVRARPRAIHRGR